MAQAYLIIFGDDQSRKQEAFTLFEKIRKKKNPQADPDCQSLIGSETKLEDLRTLKHFFSLKAYSQEPKIVFVFEIQNLKSQAQRFLGSLLDEPKGVFILTADNGGKLNEAIIQKSQTIKLSVKPLVIEPEEKKVLKEKLRQIYLSSKGERIKMVESFSSSLEAILFCQKLLLLYREKLLSSIKDEESRQSLDIIRKIGKTVKVIEANVNYRFALENLFLSLPRE